MLGMIRFFESHVRKRLEVFLNLDRFSDEEIPPNPSRTSLPVLPGNFDWLKGLLAGRAVPLGTVIGKNSLRLPLSTVDEHRLKVGLRNDVERPLQGQETLQGRAIDVTDVPKKALVCRFVEDSEVEIHPSAMEGHIRRKSGRTSLFLKHVTLLQYNRAHYPISPSNFGRKRYWNP